LIGDLFIHENHKSIGAPAPKLSKKRIGSPFPVNGAGRAMAGIYAQLTVKREDFSSHPFN
jgi:hypothetical protein